MIYALIGYAVLTPLLVWGLLRLPDRIDVRSEQTWEMQGYLVPAIIEANPTDWDDLEGLV